MSPPQAPRKGHNQCRDADIVFAYVYRVVWRWWLILHLYRQTHTNRHRHMLERVSLRVFAETKDETKKKNRNQRYDNLATDPGKTTFSSLGCSDGSCDSPATWTLHLLHLNTRIRTRSLVRDAPPSLPVALAPVALGKPLFPPPPTPPLQKPESL